MIRRINGSLPELCSRDVFGTRISGYYDTYGDDRPGAAFYAQETDGRITAVLADTFSHGTLTASLNADTEELGEFIRFLGLAELLCARETAKRLHEAESSSGYVMRYEGKTMQTHVSCINANNPAFSFRDVYELLTKCAFDLGGYDAWFSDFALRVRRGTADVRCIYKDRALASTASVLFESKDAVYLGAVATDPAFRGLGLAGQLVLSLTQCGKRAEILCGAHRVSFYTQLGFQQNGEFSICHFLK